MLALNIDGYSFAALVVLVVAAVFVIVVAARLIKREQDVRTTKLGLFIERERFDGEPTARIIEWPTQSEPAKPIPPPTPPPPLPHDETTQPWPARKED